jgi:ribosomal protein S18 acetylase RimI-like enzyme
VLLARDVADFGYPDFTIEDLHADWATPGLDLERDALVVVHRGEIVASSLLLGDDALIHVHPDSCGRGIGSELRERAEARALERGTAVLRQFIPTGNEAAAPLLLDAGYWPVQHYLRMRAELEDLPRHRDGATRVFERDQDEIAVHALVQECLGEVEGFIAEPLEVWRRQRIEKKRWDPALWLVLEDEQGLIGAALGERWDDGIGYVAQLAVAPRARGLGHGRTLLQSLFEAFRGDGLRRAELSVHGDNRGAARLYESVGMTASWEAQRWEKALGNK